MINMLILFHFIFIGNILAQDVFRCGTRNPSLEEMQSLKSLRKQWLDGGSTVITGKITIIPVAFHIIRYNDGVTGGDR